MAEIKNFVFHGKDSTGATGEWDFILDETGQISITQIVDNTPDFSGMASLDNKGQDLWNKFNAIDLDAINFPDRTGNPGENQYTIDFHSSEKDSSRTIWSNDAKSNPKIMELLLTIQNQIEKISGKKPIF